MIDSLDFQNAFRDLSDAFNTVSEKSWEIYYEKVKHYRYEDVTHAIDKVITQEERCSIAKLCKWLNQSSSTGTLSKADMQMIRDVCDKFGLTTTFANYELNQNFVYNGSKGYTLHNLPVSLVSTFCEWFEGKMVHERGYLGKQPMATPAEIRCYMSLLDEIAICKEKKVASTNEMIGYLRGKTEGVTGDLVNFLSDYEGKLKNKRKNRHGYRINGVYVKSIREVE